MVPPRFGVMKDGERENAEPPVEMAGDTSSARTNDGDGSAARHGLPANVTMLPSADRRQWLRMIEALIFASPEPLDGRQIREYLGEGADVEALLEELSQSYAGRGVNLVKVAGKWVFRTASDLSYLMERQRVEQRRLSKAALETLAVIAYHQPVTRAEIEDVRGVTTSRGTLDVLMEAGWVRPRGRRRAPGKPVTYGTTEAFLVHFGLGSVTDLPGLQELKGAGLLQSNLPADFSVPSPLDVASLMPDELPLDDEEGAELDELGLEDESSSSQDGDQNAENEGDDGGCPKDSGGGV